MNYIKLFVIFAKYIIQTTNNKEGDLKFEVFLSLKINKIRDYRD